MPQIINDAPGIGSLLGTGVGQGISSGLQQLAQIKTNQMLQRQQQRQTSNGLQALGFSPEESHQIALLPQELQGLVLKNYLTSAESAGLDQALRGVQVNSEQPSDISGISELQSPQLPQQSPLTSLLGIRQPSILDKQLPTEKVFADLMKNNVNQPEIPRATQEEKREPMAEQKPDPRNQLAELLRRPRLSPEHRLKVEALKQQRDIAENKLNAKKQEIIDSETRPVYEAIQKEAKAAKENNIRLDRMEKLNNEGDINGQQTIAALNHVANKIGLDFSGLLTADAQEFEKLSNDFIKNAKDFFPGRVTDTDLKAFLKTIPNLTQSKEGRSRVIRNLRLFNDAALLRKNASDRILKENRERRPDNYELLIEDLIKDDLDRLANEFKKGL